MKTFILLVILSIMLFSIPGCTSSQRGGNNSVIGEQVTEGIGEPPPESTTKPSGTIPAELSVTPPVESSDEAVQVDLSLSHAPAVNETAELTFSIDVFASVLKPVTKVWIEFERYDPALQYPLGRGHTKERNLEILSEKFDPSNPYYVQLKKKAAEQPETLVPQEAVVVSGNLKWDGAPLKEGDKVRLNATIRFPEEGEWLVNAWWGVEGAPPHVRTHLRLAVTKDSGTFGWPSDHSPAMEELVSDEEHPLSVKLTVAKAPRLAEATALTCSITSIRDVAEAKAQVVFCVMEKGGWRRIQVPIEEILIEGKLSWEGALKKDAPVQFSAIINFPIEGDWWIEVLGTSPEDSGGCGDSLFLNVTRESGRFGWAERHINDEGPEEVVPAHWGVKQTV